MVEEYANERYHFDKSCRLLSKQDYKNVFNQSQKVSDNCFLVLFFKKENGKPRLGLAVAKKVARLAIQRNVLKRIIRESFRQHQHQIPEVDIVVLIRSDAVKLTNAALFKKLEKLWIKLKQKVE